MRILHVGYGYRPWIVNGLVIYCEDVMDGQRARGDVVSYFFAGRRLPMVHRPFLHRWRRRGVSMFEWINTPLIVGRDRGTPEPEHDLADAPTERAFARVLDRCLPEVIHVHDLGGLPSSLPALARERSVPVVMTLHDYHALCPTIKLYDAHGQICIRERPGEMCTVCCAHAPLDNSADLDRTLIRARARIRGAVPGLGAALRRPTVVRLSDAGIRVTERVAGVREDAAPPGGAQPARARPGATAASYQRRRDTNVERLNRLDALIVSSDRSRELWHRLGVRGERMHKLHMTPAHVERLRPRRSIAARTPMRFGVLNGASTTEKGADLLVAAVLELTRRGLGDRFVLSVHGWVGPHVRPALAAHPAVRLAGEYSSDQLDDVLEDIDVGLIPSVWEEVYGFAGLEFLAKGIPVIGNDIGGIPEYVLPGRTGWLNRSCSAGGLADLMANAITRPDEVRRLADTVVERRGDLLFSFERQLADLTAVYAEARRARTGTHPDG